MIQTKKTLNDLCLYYALVTKKAKAQTTKNEFWQKWKKKLTPSKIAGRIFLFYLVIVFLGMFLLAIPGVVKNHSTIIDSMGKHHAVSYTWQFLYSLFNASSAFSDTGLSIPYAGEDYSIWGQIIIALLIWLGGFGVLTFKIMLILMLGQKINLDDLILVKNERGGEDLKNTVRLVKESFLFLTLIQFIGALALFLAFYFTNLNANQSKMLDFQMYHNFWNSLWGGIFHSISAINNAGFDILGRNSIAPYDTAYLIQFIFLLEFIIGGIGFPTFYDLKRTKFGFDKSQKLTLFTKINLITYVSISIVGVGLVCAVEYGNHSHSNILNNSSSGWNGFMNIFFNTMSTRNAGFSTVTSANFLGASKIIQALMMFIGSAPSSTAGGIRTTTFAVIIITLISFARNRKYVTAFKKEIPEQTIKTAFLVLFTALSLILLDVILIVATNQNVSMNNAFFTVSSAFGTTGLNAIDPWTMYNLGWSSILLTSLIMFVGQLGVSATLLSWAKTTPQNQMRYLQEEIKVG